MISQKDQTTYEANSPLFDDADLHTHHRTFRILDDLRHHLSYTRHVYVFPFPFPSPHLSLSEKHCHSCTSSPVKPLSKMLFNNFYFLYVRCVG